MLSPVSCIQVHLKLVSVEETIAFDPKQGEVFEAIAGELEVEPSDLKADHLFFIWAKNYFTDLAKDPESDFPLELRDIKPSSYGDDNITLEFVSRFCDDDDCDCGREEGSSLVSSESIIELVHVHLCKRGINSFTVEAAPSEILRVRNSDALSHESNEETISVQSDFWCHFRNRVPTDDAS
tara:strand:- start:12989 stop:13531 length:543 start_codon:yes stop_codon:yes gene_type:complete